MKAIYLGEVIRRRRKALRLSQAMVCKGLCTIMTLSRFESEIQTPSRDCVAAMLQRLGLPDKRYHAQLTKAEIRLVRLRKEVVACCTQFEQSLESEREQARINTLEKLHELEHYVKRNDRINQQFILGIKATVETHSPEEQLEMLMKAIRLTCPRFELDELGTCLYSTNEVALISQIAIRYALCGQRRKAIDIYGQLLKIILKQTFEHDCLPMLTSNYALYLGLENRFEESLEIAEIGRRACIKQESYLILPKLLHIEAECQRRMGKIHRSLELYQSACAIYGATLNTKHQEIVRADIQELCDLIL